MIPPGEWKEISQVMRRNVSATAFVATALLFGGVATSGPAVQNMKSYPRICSSFPGSMAQTSFRQAVRTAE